MCRKVEKKPKASKKKKHSLFLVEMAKIKLRPFTRTSKEAAARLAIAVFVASSLGYAVLLPNLPKRGKDNSEKGGRRQFCFFFRSIF